MKYLPDSAFSLNNPEVQAMLSVKRETDAHILNGDYPYTRTALWQMGWERGKGMTEKIRVRFAHAFVDAWVGRFEALTGKAVL